MPLYDLKCNECGVTCEQLVRQSELDKDGNLKHFECPYCGQTQSGYSKCLSISTTFQLKGGGWYEDGYASRVPKDSE